MFGHGSQLVFGGRVPRQPQHAPAFRARRKAPCSAASSVHAACLKGIDEGTVPAAFPDGLHAGLLLGVLGQRLFDHHFGNGGRKGAQPVLVTPLARNTWTADGRYNDLLAEYAAAVFDLGRQEQVPVIDLHGYAMEGICAEGRERSKRWFYPGDYTHTNDFGACRFAAFVAGRLCALAGRPAPAVPVREPSGPMLPLTPPADAAPTGETPFAVYETQQPDAPLTRADALCQITATLKLFPVNGYKSPFADVVGQAPFAGAVQSAVQSGLIPEHWTADGCLHPGQSVTLAEFLEVLRPGYAARRPLPAGAVADQAVQAGWIDAGADLNGVLTRAQGAAICRRVQI